MANAVTDNKDKDKDREGEKGDSTISRVASSDSHVADPHNHAPTPTTSKDHMMTMGGVGVGVGVDRIISSKDGNHVRLNGVALSFVKVT